MFLQQQAEKSMRQKPEELTQYSSLNRAGHSLTCSHCIHSMKQLLYQIFALGLLALSFPQTLEASHFMGVDISYECVGPCTYRIYHKTYYDCTGGAMGSYIPVSTSPPPPAPGASFSIVGIGGCVPPTAISGWVAQSYEEVTPICPALLNPGPGILHPTGCDIPNNPSPPINGVVEAVYYIDYNFCNTTCTEFNIQWSQCCRNDVISSISNPGSSGIGSFSTLINTAISPCNSSPTFINPPVPYICAGQPFTFNQGANDIDGDSLSYALGPCAEDDGSGVVVPYLAPGFSPTQPLGPTWDVTINPLTGDVTMTPAPSGSEVVGVMCVVVTEWRNGVQIGQITRDMQITVINNCSSSNPATQGVQNVTIGTDAVPADALSFNEVRVCSDVEICFDIPAISQDSTLSYNIWWSQNIPGATFSDPTNPAITDTISGAEPTGRFCWTPPLGAEGAYFFVVSVQDDACPIPGFNQFTIIVYVEETLINSYSQAVPIGCNDVELSVVPSSSIPSIYNNVFPTTQWNGNGNLNLNPNLSSPSLVHTYPAPSTYFYTLFLEDTFGCSINLPGLVDLTTGVFSNAGPDVTICANYDFTLGTPAVPGLTYTWTPGDALDDSTLAQPTFTYPGDSLIQTSFEYVLEVTDGICTTYDYTAVIVNPSLEADIQAADSSICIGDSTELTAIGNLTSGYTYQWSTGDTTETIMVSPTTTTTYSVVTFNNGCSSDPAFITVNVETGPQAQIFGVLEICPGKGTTLTATGGDSYVWSVAGFTGPSIVIGGIFQDSAISVVAANSLGCPGLPATVVIDPFPAPTPSFIADTVCEGLSTSFVDNSFLESGVFVDWDWDFGDGSPVQGSASPSHTYTTPGTYDVQLITTTDNGCIDSVTLPITVSATPEAEFTYTEVCQGLNNDFLDASTIEAGNTISSYNWLLGDGTELGGVQNLTHQYDTFGYFNVTLTVATAEGCFDSQTRTVLVYPNPVADFEVISACEDSVVLASSASTVPGFLDFVNSYSWDFGDDPASPTNTSTLANPVHVYPVATDYLITHSITTLNGCTDQVQRVVTVYPSPEASFTYDLNCENEQTEFYNQSTADPATPIVEWFWDLGVPNQTSDKEFIRYRYLQDGPGVYTVALGVKTSEGCVDTAYQEVIINPAPRTRFEATTECLNDSSQFTDVTQLASGELTGWNYDFGDGSGVATYANPAYQYREAGTYSVTFIAVSDSGCTNTITREVEVKPLPTIFFTQEDSSCFGNQASLLVVADPEVEISWYYSVDDEEQPFHVGNSFVTPPLPYSNTYYVQPTTSDSYRCTNVRQPITATVYEDESLELVVSQSVVEIPLAVVEFSTAATVPIVDWQWNFGDGSTASVATPIHEYAYPGKYEVKVSTRDRNGCEQSLSTVVEVKLVTGISLPTAFSPNGDGINDRFTVGHYNVRDFQIKIFNRWGQKIYESDNPDFSWSGEHAQGGMVREGVYVYVVEAIDLNGNEINESATLTVLK
jgi:gliding motility-associated-like protein